MTTPHPCMVPHLPTLCSLPHITGWPPILSGGFERLHCYASGRAHGQLGTSLSASQKRMSGSGHLLELSPSGRSALGSPIDRASTLSTSTELGSSSLKISQYERNPPAEDGDLGESNSLIMGRPQPVSLFSDRKKLVRKCCDVARKIFRAAMLNVLVLSITLQLNIHEVCLEVRSFLICCLAGRERVHRWWHTKQLSMTENVIMGKPSVLFRKLINTVGNDGNLSAVNAQQYAVLVMDVPDLIAEQERCATCPRVTIFLHSFPCRLTARFYTQCGCTSHVHLLRALLFI